MVFVALLAVPRIVRLLYPQVWIEDESYLNGAFMLARGWMPYRDFPLPHLPVLELLMAGLFQMAPVAIRTAELCTAAAAFAGSALVFQLGSDWERRGEAPAHTSTAAALLFATSPLLFRYHVFEREVFVVPAVLAAVWTIARQRPAAAPRAQDRAACAAGALLALAMTIKLTAIAALVGLVVDRIVVGRRRTAVLMATTAVGLVGLVTLALTARFGTDFVVQVVLFRLVHATFPGLGTKIDEMRYSLDLALAIGGMGVVLLAWTGAWRQWILPLLQLASGVVFLVLLNPTYWAHTGIELLPWLSLPAGYLIAAFGSVIVGGLRQRRTSAVERRPTGRRATTGRTPRRPASDRLPVIACAAGAVVLLVTAVPFRNVNWQSGDGSPFGFGYRDRSEIAAAAAFVRAHAARDDLVATPPIIAFAANRREVVPYAEVAGEVDELTASVHREGWLATVRDEAGTHGSFWESVDASRTRMEPVLARAVRSHTARVIIDDSADDLFPIPMVNVRQDALEASGYRLGAVWPHYEAWVSR
jgi:hypothetical protein